MKILSSRVFFCKFLLHHDYFQVLQKILLIDQFKNLETNIIKRNANAKLIYKKLQNSKNYSFPQKIFDSQNIYIDFPIIVNENESKKKLWSKSLKKSIDVKNYYYANCGNNRIYEKYENYSKCNNAENLSRNIFMLPVNQKMKKSHINQLISLFADA